MKKVLLVDGHSIANRAFYGVPMLSNTQGIYTNAVYGFINILLKTIETEQPTHLAVAFDQKAPTFRHKMYEEYKGTRKGMPEELHAQIPLIQEFLRLAGIQVILQEGIEADDILGTLGKREAAGGAEVAVLSGDRDLLQLAEEHLRILIPRTQKGVTETHIYDAQAVQAEYGVTPREFIEVKAMMGDTSDNIPGVPGIGEKTAVSIIQKYHTVEEAIAHVEEVRPPRASKNLAEYAQQARLSLALATIVTDAQIEAEPLPFTMEAFGAAEVIEFLKKYEFRSLVQRFQPYASSEIKGKSNCEVHVIETEKELARLAEKLKKGFAYRIYEEEDGLFGFWAMAFSCQSGEGWWVEEGKLLREDVLRVIGPVFEDDTVPKTGHDVKEDMLKLHKNGVCLNGLRMDTMIAAYLLNPSKETYTEDELAQIFLQETIASDDEVFGSGREKKKLPDLAEEQRAEYGASRAEILRRVTEILEKELENKGMTRLFQDIERPLITVLASMEELGIRVDPAVLREFGQELDQNITVLQRRIMDAAGEEFNILSPKQLGEILFEKLGLPAGKKTKSGYSTSADILEKLAPEYPIVRDILQYRQLTKLKSTYVEGLYPCIREDGKIHSRFNQTVTATGRLSSSDPNLQNIPIRTELGRLLRKAFIPSGPEYRFMDADYSQIELRLLAHMSQDEQLIGAYHRGEDIHRLTASQILGIPPEEVTPAQRSSAKAVNFGIIYGISAFSLGDDLHITQKEAKAYIERYFQQYPKVKGYLDGCVEEAKEKGYSVTLFGRRRIIDELKSANFVKRSFGERVAKNMPIQGTAADIIKIAMVRVYERLKREGRKSRLLLTVHDELLIEVYRGEEEAVEELLRYEMMHAADLLVPLEVEIHTGDNWYEAK